jgi:hypothetical protein
LSYKVLRFARSSSKLSKSRSPGGERDVSTPRNYQASIEQLHQEVEALAEEMRRPAPAIVRVTLLPFSIGAAFALTMFAVIAFAVKHV